MRACAVRIRRAAHETYLQTEGRGGGVRRLCREHRCYYCFAPNVLHRERDAFHSCVEPRKDIVAELRRQLEREQITGQLVHLCFTCDPYPTGHDTTATREVVQTLKEFGNHVQILTKGDGSRDFDLLDGGDW